MVADKLLQTPADKLHADSLATILAPEALCRTLSLTGRSVRPQLKKKQVHPHCVDQEQSQEQCAARPGRSDTTDALRQHMRIFVFTFKLACLFLVCSLPYKLAIVLFCLGAHSSVNAIRLLALVRMLYFILDGWTFCSNSELLDAVRAMFKGTRSRESLDGQRNMMNTA